MTLDEAIKHAEEVAEENQKVVDTGIVFDDVTIDMLYCDDTEVIEEHLANYQMCAEEHRQLAEWLKDYKRMLEQEPCENSINREDTLKAMIEKLSIRNEDYLLPAEATLYKVVKNMPPVTPQAKIGYWRPIYQGDEIIDYRCSECEFGCTFGKSTYGMNYCPKCGAKMIESEKKHEQNIF